MFSTDFEKSKSAVFAQFNTRGKITGEKRIAFERYISGDFVLMTRDLSQLMGHPINARKLNMRFENYTRFECIFLFPNPFRV
jgi:hypothetical protein